MIKGLIVSENFGYKEVLGKSLIDIIVERNKNISQFFVLIKKSLLPKYKEHISSNVIYIFDDEKEEISRYLNIDDKIVVLYDNYYIEREIKLEDYDECFKEKKYYVISTGGVLLQSDLDFNLLRKKLVVERNEALINSGVDIFDVDNTYINYDSDIGLGTIVYPGTIISASVVGKACSISGKIKDSIIKDEVIVDNSVVEDCIIDAEVSIGPFSYVHNECVLKEGCTIGSYVELKKVIVGKKSKIKHQSVLLDCVIGENVNIGAGVITANYDGKMKHISRIENDAFVGCNSVIISPINIGENSFIAADTTVVKNVDADEFSISRVKQENKKKRKINI